MLHQISGGIWSHNSRINRVTGCGLGGRGLILQEFFLSKYVQAHYGPGGKRRQGNGEDYIKGSFMTRISRKIFG
jgi:hypothetical protein